MGEEEKKQPLPEEAKKEETAKAEEPAEDTKKKEEKKPNKSMGGEAAPPPPPPPEIVLKVFMHCEACARKVRRCLKGFEGVEEVITDCRASKVIVKGEKADPVKVLERVQKKSHRQVDLISPIPRSPAEEPPKPPEKEAPKPKEEPQVISVVLGVNMHCDACAQEIKRRILRMKGVENVEPDLKGSKVTVKGLIEPEKLCDYVHKRTGKHAKIINVEPAKKEEAENAKSEEEKAALEAGEKDASKKAEADQESKEAAVPAEGGGGAEQMAKVAPMPGGGESDDPVSMESKKNEVLMYNQYPQNFQMYPQRYVQEMNSYPPQIFSDENPNACCVM